MIETSLTIAKKFLDLISYERSQSSPFTLGSDINGCKTNLS